jgi:hypothetical protein
MTPTATKSRWVLVLGPPLRWALQTAYLEFERLRVPRFAGRRCTNDERGEHATETLECERETEMAA